MADVIDGDCQGQVAGGAQMSERHMSESRLHAAYRLCM